MSLAAATELPRLRGGAATRSVFLVVGLFVFATGILAMLESGLGLSPWDVLHQGLSEHTALSFGEANVAVSVVVLVLAWLLGARFGIGTIANAVLVGAFLAALAASPLAGALGGEPLAVRAGLLVTGIVLMGVGTALYLGAGLGPGPRDSLMVVGARRTPFRIGVVRAAIELFVLAAGVTLGGTVGIGTIAFALGIGAAVELSFRTLAHSRLAVSP
jgi:uncharacterized membrane protein YczE